MKGVLGPSPAQISFGSPLHSNPHNAVEIFLTTKCRKTMGIHWGTWALTSEKTDEPPVKLREALKSRSIPETGVFDVCAVGESVNSE
jgi:L-ascorbate metabolism protein UlaG (beta-lactamase superfamily)